MKYFAFTLKVGMKCHCCSNIGFMFEIFALNPQYFRNVGILLEILIMNAMVIFANIDAKLAQWKYFNVGEIFYSHIARIGQFISKIHPIFSFKE